MNNEIDWCELLNRSDDEIIEGNISSHEELAMRDEIIRLRKILCEVHEHTNKLRLSMGYR